MTNHENILSKLFLLTQINFLFRVLKNSNRSTENIQLISKDFRFLVQGACSINRLLLKRCEGLLREYIVNFPELVFQQENLIAIAETLNILYKKVKSEFESISSILKAEFLYEKIVLPNNHVIYTLKN